MGIIYNELLIPGETVNTNLYQQQLNDLNRPLLGKSQEKDPIERSNTKSFFLHVNTPSHTAKSVLDMLDALNWEVLLHAVYSPGLVPSDYQLFAWLGHALAGQCFGSYEDQWFAAKGENFYWCGVYKLLEE